MGGAFLARKTLTGNDYFPTYHALTELLCDKIKIESNCDILDPFAGNGDITDILQKRFPLNAIFASDINPRNDRIENFDFFDIKNNVDYIISNPPYNIFQKVFSHALKYFDKGMYLLLPLDYLHGIERFDSMYKTDNILKMVYVLVRRPLFSSKYSPSGPMPTGASTFAWFYFEKGYTGYPIIDWIDNREYMGTPVLNTAEKIAKKTGFLLH